LAASDSLPKELVKSEYANNKKKPLKSNLIENELNKGWEEIYYKGKIGTILVEEHPKSLLEPNELFHLLMRLDVSFSISTGGKFELGRSFSPMSTSSSPRSQPRK